MQIDSLGMRAMRGIVNNCDCVIEIRDARVSESFLFFIMIFVCLDFKGTISVFEEGRGYEAKK